MLTWITRLLHPLPLIPAHNLSDVWAHPHIPVGWLLHCPPTGVCRAQLSLVGARCFLCTSASSSWLAQTGAAFAGWRCCSLSHRHWAGRKVLNTHVCSSVFCLPFWELGWTSSCLKHIQQVSVHSPFLLKLLHIYLGFICVCMHKLSSSQISAACLSSFSLLSTYYIVFFRMAFAWTEIWPQSAYLRASK